MTRTVLVAGTASHVGKSTVAAGLCRLLADRGVDVAPFKGQNMSNNARVVPRPGPDGGEPWGEIGVSQSVQARAARIPARADMNPVLLKPTGEGTSQVVIHGEAVEHVPAGEYYDTHWERAREAAETSYGRLAADHDVVVAEGAGSIAEPNLAHRDLANRETATFADAEILLVADIERGGAFASALGTLELMPDELRERVAGVLLTKFRGDESILEPAIEDFEERTGVPILGVIPHDDPGLPAEDSVDLPSGDAPQFVGEDDVPAAESVAVAVPRLPRISNVTDLEPVAREPGVRVSYVPLAADLADAGVDGRDPDAIVLPGTKHTVGDLLSLREHGMAGAIRDFEGPVVGLCGGYQLLGRRITDTGVESGATPATVEGLGLLPVETTFSAAKTVERVTRELHGVGPLSGAAGEVTGYEIHMGETTALERVERPFPGRGAATERVLGTYLHGLLENRVARRAFVEAVFESAGLTPPEQVAAEREPASAAADLLRDHADLDALDLPTG